MWMVGIPSALVIGIGEQDPPSHPYQPLPFGCAGEKDRGKVVRAEWGIPLFKSSWHVLFLRTLTVSKSTGLFSLLLFLGQFIHTPPLWVCV